VTYHPNINDPRTRNRIKQALGFARGVLSDTKPHGWSTRYIDQFFGNQSRPLGKWLRSQLLITTNDHWSKDLGLCKQYILNREGWERVRSLLFDNIYSNYPIVTEVQLVKETFQEKFNKELKSCDFTYKDQSSRLWHPLQNVRKEFRVEILADAGLPYQYDIECCAPTMILQHSRVCGNDEVMFALNGYLRNRHAIRRMLARQTEIPEDAVKVIINALLAGAPLSLRPTTDLYKLLQGDCARIEFLKQHHYLVALRKDFKKCWDYINQTLPQRYVTTKRGVTRRVPLNSKRKWGVYFDLERRVINSVRTYLLEGNNKCFLEHDGWTCKNELDEGEIIKHIKQHTGFEIKLELKNHCKTIYSNYPIVTEVAK
jgi:hypothetical protein